MDWGVEREFEMARNELEAQVGGATLATMVTDDDSDRRRSDDRWNRARPSSIHDSYGSSSTLHMSTYPLASSYSGNVYLW